MEAATVLILPQLVLDAENYLEEEARDLLSAALIEQVSVWEKSLPEAGLFSSTWKWLPSLGI